MLFLLFEFGKKKCFTYIYFILQILLTKVNQEVRHFMMYLQDVSRLCVEDYNVISKGALRYTEVPATCFVSTYHINE